MTAGISIDLRSAIPPYEQIRAQIASLVSLGVLPAGTRLPPVRRLASDLGIAAGTVARAYKELEQAGLTSTGRRNGTVVTGLPPAPLRGGPRAMPAAGAELVDAVDRFIAAGRSAGLNDDALVAVVRTRLSQQDG